MNSRTADKFVVRLPEGMRERIAHVARVNHRSMNSEIIDRLERSMSETGDEPLVAEVEGLLVEHDESWHPALNMLVETPALEPATIKKIVMRDQQLFAVLDILRPDHTCEGILPLASLRPLVQRKRVFEG